MFNESSKAEFKETLRELLEGITLFVSGIILFGFFMYLGHNFNKPIREFLYSTEIKENINSTNLGERVNILENKCQGMRDVILFQDKKIDDVWKFLRTAEEIRSETTEYSKPNY